MTTEMPFRLSFRTERMDFRPLTLADGSDFLEIANDPVIADAVEFLNYPVSLEDIEKLITKDAKDNCFLGGRWIGGGDLAAVVGMHRHGPRIEIGYLVRRDRHGQGLATEAASGLIAALADRYPEAALFAECHPDNSASRHILASLGFVPTGAQGKRNARLEFELPASAM